MARLIHTAIAAVALRAGLVDEVRLFLTPVLVGALDRYPG